LIKGIERYGPGRMFSKTGVWAKKPRDWKKVEKKPKAKLQSKVKKFQGGERVIKKKIPRAFDEKYPKKQEKKKNKTSHR
jgi:hypothetical protein